MPRFSTGFKKSLAALNASRTALESPIMHVVDLVSAYHLEHDGEGVTPPDIRNHIEESWLVLASSDAIT